MTVLRQEILRIAKLAHLELSDAQIERHAGELARFLEYVEVLQSAETRVPASREGAHPALREDEASNPADNGASLAQAPALYDNLFYVPRFFDH